MAILATFGQTRLRFNLSALQPKLSRLDPRARLSRMFGATALLEVLRAAAKLAIVALGAWVALAGAVPGFVAALSWTPISLTGEIRGRLITIATSVLGAFAVVAVLDVVIVQWQHWRKLRMSRQEIRDEHRDTEGDPLIKRRIRQLQQQRARRRMMAAVPKATVVLTNPTHYAVALAYDRAAGGAPKVVAKGADEVAARIREMAEKHGVPLVANPPLARALFKVELGGEIPAEHYRLVAEIIAYVWRLRGHAAGNA
jgi:flagellar biosynthetic protein FlhB